MHPLSYSSEEKHIYMAKLPETKSKDKLQEGKHICNSYHKEQMSLVYKEF